MKKAVLTLGVMVCLSAVVFAKGEKKGKKEAAKANTEAAAPAPQSAATAAAQPVDGSGVAAEGACGAGVGNVNADHDRHAEGDA